MPSECKRVWIQIWPENVPPGPNLDQTVYKGCQQAALVGKASSNSYTIGCPSVRGDNPRALVRGLSYVQVDKHGTTILCHINQYMCIDVAHHDIFNANVGKGGII